MCVTFFFHLRLFSCFAAMLLSIDQEKNAVSRRSLICFPSHSYPFCVLLSWFLYTPSALDAGLTVWIRYIMFCLPSLMMFAIYIKIQSLNYLCYPPAERPFHQKRNASRISIRWGCGLCVLRASENDSFSSHIIKQSSFLHTHWTTKTTLQMMILTRQFNRNAHREYRIYCPNSFWVRESKTYRLKSWKTQFAKRQQHFSMKTHKIKWTKNRLSAKCGQLCALCVPCSENVNGRAGDGEREKWRNIMSWALDAQDVIVNVMLFRPIVWPENINNLFFLSRKMKRRSFPASWCA